VTNDEPTFHCISGPWTPPPWHTLAAERAHVRYVGLIGRFSVTKLAASSVPETSRVSDTSWPCQQTDALLRIMARLRNGSFDDLCHTLMSCWAAMEDQLR
jgi:hypothetical protein